MSIVKIEHLSLTYFEKTLYQDETFQVNAHEHIGLIGSNGAGKSTLIKVLTDQVVPDSGQITWQKRIKRGYLDQYAQLPLEQTVWEFLRSAFQELIDAAQQLEQTYQQLALHETSALWEQAGQIQNQLEQQGYYDIDTKISQVATGLGIDLLGYERPVGQLSGGQRSKLILTKLLLEKPDILLLDEPTNYLDKQHIAWLVTYLQSFANAFIVISHDYHFLQQVVDTVYDLEQGHLTRYKGTLRQALQQRAANQRTYLKTYASQQQKIMQAQAYIQKNHAGSRAKSAKSRQRQLAKMQVLSPPANRKIPQFYFEEVPLTSQIAIQVTKLKIGYQQSLLKQELNFSIRNHEKVVISGFNGVGKTTLIKTLMQQLPPVAGTVKLAPLLTIAYYRQILSWPQPTMSPLTYLHEQFPEQTTKILRQTLAQVALTSKQVQEPIQLLSGGEQSKIKLAELLLQPANLLVLDEPTNHLDELSKSALRSALAAYTGTVILVTHETHFYDDTWIDREINIAQLT